MEWEAEDDIAQLREWHGNPNDGEPDKLRCGKCGQVVWQNIDGYDHECVRCDEMADHDCATKFPGERGTCCVCFGHDCEDAKTERRKHPAAGTPEILNTWISVLASMPPTETRVLVWTTRFGKPCAMVAALWQGGEGGLSAYWCEDVGRNAFAPAYYDEGVPSPETVSHWMVLPSGPK